MASRASRPGCRRRPSAPGSGRRCRASLGQQPPRAPPAALAAGPPGHPGHPGSPPSRLPAAQAPRRPGSPPPQAAPPDLPQTRRRHCGSDALMEARAARGGAGRGGAAVLRGGPGPCSPRPRPWPSSKGTSIFQTPEGRLSFGS